MKRFRFNSIILLTSVLTNAAIASDSCTPYELDAPGMPLEHSPVYHQSDSSWCWVFTATQMLDGYRFAQGTEYNRHYTSPIAAGMSMALNQYVDSLKEGLKMKPDPRFPNGYLYNPYNEASPTGDGVCKAIENIKKEGSCDHRRLSGMLGGIKEPLAMFKKLSPIDALKQFDLKTADLALQEYGYPIDRNANQMPSYLLTQCDHLNPAENIVKDLGLEAIDQVFNSPVFNASYLRAEAEIIRNRCTGHRIKVSAPPCQYHEFVRSKKSSKEVLAKLHELGSRKNPTPIGIGYCPGIRQLGKGYQGVAFWNEPDNAYSSDIVTKIRGLEKKFHSLYPEKHFSQPIGCENDMSGHASVVIGRRRNPKTGQCQFKVRDTYGGDCELVSPDWECSKKGIWIDDIDLAKNVTSAYSI